MRSIWQLLLILVACGAPAYTATINSRDDCSTACRMSLRGVRFAGRPNSIDGFWKEECGNDLHVRSILFCSRAYCSWDDFSFNYDSLSTQCLDLANITLPDRESISGVPDDIVESYKTLTFDHEEVLARQIILPTTELYEIAIGTIHKFSRIRETHSRYSLLMFAFWFVVLVLGTIYHLATRVWRLQTWEKHLNSSNFKLLSDESLSKIWTSICANILDPPTFNYKCQTPHGQCTIPPRAETLLITLFFILNVIFCSISYDIYTVDLFFRDHETEQAIRYISDRTGYLAYANLGISWLFGMRNNLLIWCTGWNFATFNRFHRWVARFATVEAIVHSIGYTVYSIHYRGWKDYFANFGLEYWYTGVIATVAMSLLFPASLLWLRTKHYDAFLILHVGLAIICLVTLFYHTAIFRGSFDWYLWICVGIWIVDRLLRCWRLWVCWYYSKGVKARIEYLAAADLVRIDITDIVASRKVPAECHYYVYAPFTWHFWQSHPFSLVRWEDQALDYEQEGSSLELQSHESIDSDREALLEASNPKLRVRYGFLVRPYNGFTRRLIPSSGAQVDAAYDMSLLLEGPYPGGAHLEACTDILLIMGGSGIAAGISCIYRVLDTMPRAAITLAWAAKTAPIIESVLETELRVAIHSRRVAVDAYVTQEESFDDSKLAALCRSVSFHRPFVPALVHDAASKGTGTLAVVVCGPARMTDDTRAAVVQQLKNGQSHVRLFAESFNW